MGTMDIPFPLKGLNTVSARFAQPDNTSPSLLNVLPFDSSNRARGGQRPGVRKIFASAIGNGSQVVQAMAQTTLSLDPSSVTASTLAFDADFTTYPLGSLDTTSGTIWNSAQGTSDDNGSGFFFSSTNKIEVVAGGARAVTGSDGPSAAGVKTSISLGNSYILRATATVFGQEFSLTGHNCIKLVTHVNNTTFANQSENIMLRCNRRFIDIVQGTTIKATFSFSGDLTTSSHVIELRVSGTTYTGWVDGVQYVSASVTPTTSQTGVGIGMGRTGSDPGDRIARFQVYTAIPVATFRQTNITAVCGGNVYLGTISSGFGGIVSGGTSVLSNNSRPQIATRTGIAFYVDGYGDIIQLDLTSQTISTFTPTAGSETKATLGANTLICVWRDRLVVASSFSSPQNFYMSRQGNPYDWDYSQTDSAAAVAGNASRAGGIGEPLNALIPWNDDVLILGGDHSIYKVEGDIAAGGQILTVSESLGTYGPDAYDIDPDGNLWFVGTGGLYMIGAGSAVLQPKSSSKVRGFFNNINRASSYVNCTWDRERSGLWIHVTPVNNGAATHIFYDSELDAFFPVAYPNVIGPMTAFVYDGDGPSDRLMLLGGRDGYIRVLDPAVLSDDGVKIDSYVHIGPIRPGPEDRLSIIKSIEVITGEPPTGFTSADWTLDIGIKAGKDAYSADNNPERTINNAVTNPYRSKRLMKRIQGGVFFFVPANSTINKTWSMEKLVVTFDDAGLQRRY